MMPRCWTSAKYRPITQQFLVKYQCMFHLKVRTRGEKTFHWISFPKVTKISKIENSWKIPPWGERKRKREREKNALNRGHYIMPATPKVKTTLTMKYLRRRQTYNMKENQRMTKWFWSLLAKKSLFITLTNVPTRVQNPKELMRSLIRQKNCK